MNKAKLVLCLLVLLVVVPLNPFVDPVQAQKSKPKVFGRTDVPEIASMNWTVFWQLFNRHSMWTLEYLDGETWLDAKQDLAVLRKYFITTNEGDIQTDSTWATKCKIALDFTASHSADYRLTFGVDLDVKNYTYKESIAKYVLTYKNYTVFFDFSDLKSISGLVFNHGIKIINGEQWFWFRIRRNNVPQGAHIILDPTFGYETEGTYWENLAHWIRGSWFTCPAKGTALSITVYLHVFIDGNVTCAIYWKSNATLLAQTEERELNESEGTNWFTFNFTSTVNLTQADYVLVAWSDHLIAIWGSSEPVPYKGRCDYTTYTGSYPNPCDWSEYAYLHSIYCTYTAEPSIGSFNAPSSVEANEIFLLEATITDYTGLDDFVNATIEITADIILLWVNSTNTFSEYSDPNDYCFFRTNSTRTTLSDVSYKLSWRISLNSNYTATEVDVIENNTIVYDKDGHTGNGSYDNLFTFTTKEYSGQGSSGDGEPVDWTEKEPTPISVPSAKPAIELPFELGVTIIVCSILSVAVFSQIRKGSTRQGFKQKTQTRRSSSEARRKKTR